MRVLLISHNCQSRTEGQPKAEWLGRQPDVDLCVLTPDRWRHYGAWRRAEVPDAASFTLEVGRTAWPWAGPAQFYLHWYPELAALLRTFRPDVIDLFEEPWGLVSAQACLLRNRLLPQTKILCETEQNIDKRLPLPFERFRAYTLQNTDYAVARNAEAVSVLAAKGYTGPVEVVPNAVDAEMFRPMHRETCRRELGLDGFVVGYVGRMVEEKGVPEMLDALALCPPDVNMVFVGSGPLQHELQGMAASRGLSGRVRVLPGRPLEDLPQVMNAMDVLAVPSRTTRSWKEQFGRVIIEAHACGTPVIGSDSGAIPDVIGKAGIVVPERDPVALANAIRRLSCSPELSRALGQFGRLQVETCYTWERVAERMASIYRRMAVRFSGSDLFAAPAESQEMLILQK